MILLVTALPLISFVLCSLTGSMLGHWGSYSLSTICVGTCTLLSWVGFVSLSSSGVEIQCTMAVWIPLSENNMEWAMVWDFLSTSMLTIVTLVSFLVHVYSGSYMSGDPHVPRFMSYLSLFTFFMVVLVQAENLLVLFMGWEGVGLCSYLLINFWFTSVLANTSAIKAMLVNSVGDLALVVGLIGLWELSGDLALTYGGLGLWEGTCYVDALCLLMLVGVAGKSAQLGLHSWLPDAMEGPTPVSALIHAATMVTAGVFLVVSLSSLFELAHLSLLYVVLLGSVTSLFAASMGLAQEDMKKIIAYSTTSQLGYMIASCGMGQFNLGLSHLMNHAYFKALLFLSAGAIIHNNMDQQDVSKLGNMWNSIVPYTSIIVGSISLMGFPLLTGYYSKDLIVENAFLHRSWVMVLLVAAASLTAAYSAKMMWKSFFSGPYTESSSAPPTDSNDFFLLLPLVVLAVGSVCMGYLLQDVITPNTQHPMLSTPVKMAPLVVSMVAILAYVILYHSIPFIYRSSKMRSMVEFLQWAWHFNFIINETLMKSMWKHSHHSVYKLLDSGWMESMFPSGSSLLSTLLASSVSGIQSGLISDYLLYLVILFSLTAGITH